MVGESIQNELLIQIDASSFAEFKISELEIARVDCINQTLTWSPLVGVVGDWAIEVVVAGCFLGDVLRSVSWNLNKYKHYKF